MRQYLGLLLVVFIALLTSCRNDFNFEPSAGGLEFSKDTVYLDTVFTNIGSSTYTLKVYNKSDKNIAIPSIRLNKGQASKYRLMVDGIPGKEFTNIEMLAKDSMFVFVEVTQDVANANPTDFLYTDFIEFNSTSGTQKVELVTLIQDAYFIYPSRTPNGNGGFDYEEINLGNTQDPIPVRASILNETDPINGNELIWNNSKPYVIYGYAFVPPSKTLKVEEGARIHFHANSGIIVANNASLFVDGKPSTTNALEKEVVFESDRLEPDFSDVAGQWGTIWLTNGSHSNVLNNLTIKNAVIGLYVNGNDGTNSVNTTLHNVQIYNCSNYGLLATTGFIEGKNVVINNCGEASFAGVFGGNYDFTHCTFANYWSTPNQTCVVLSDDKINDVATPLTKADFKNCIVYGSTNLGISLKKEGTIFEYKFDHCLLKFIDTNNQFATNTLYQFATNSKFENCIIATNSTTNKPDFLAPNENKLIIGSNSAAKGMANAGFSTFKDILDKPRNTSYDLGAYNFIIFD